MVLTTTALTVTEDLIITEILLQIEPIHQATTVAHLEATHLAIADLQEATLLVVAVADLDHTAAVAAVEE